MPNVEVYIHGNGFQGAAGMILVSGESVSNLIHYRLETEPSKKDLKVSVYHYPKDCNSQNVSFVCVCADKATHIKETVEILKQVQKSAKIKFSIKVYLLEKLIPVKND